MFTLTSTNAPNSVRSTNVYEEKSLGVYHESNEEEEEAQFRHDGPRMHVWGRYLAMHARQQLAFGELRFLPVRRSTD